MRRLMVPAIACGLTLLLAVPAQAQLNGSHTPGDFGVQSGSQPQPGFYAALFYLRYDADTIKDGDGNVVRLSPSAPGSIAVAAAAPLAWYVSKAKVLGANYGAMAVLPFANASIEAPAFALGGPSIPASPTCCCGRSTWAGTPRGQTSAPGFSCTRRRDGTSAAAATTSAKACGPTSRSWGRRCTSTRSGPSARRHRLLGVSRQEEGYGRKVGQILTLQGGLAKSFLGGGLITGAADYAQWKLTEDQWLSSSCQEDLRSTSTSPASTSASRSGRM